MRSRSLPLLGAAALGFAAAVLALGAWAPRAASAQLNSTRVTSPPLGALNLQPVQTGMAVPQPIEIQSLDDKHFVVATREPRLVQQIGREGTAQQMLVPVVTYYTVKTDGLLPLEHVRVPTGYRAIRLEE